MRTKTRAGIHSQITAQNYNKKMEVPNYLVNFSYLFA